MTLTLTLSRLLVPTSILATVFGAIIGAPAATVAAKGVKSTPASADLAQLAHQLAAAKSVKFTGTIAIIDDGYAPEAVAGSFEAPGRYHITVDRDGARQAEFASNGARYVAYASSAGQFTEGKAAADHVAAADASFGPFVQGALGTVEATAVVMPLLTINRDFVLRRPAPESGITEQYSVTRTVSRMGGQTVYVCKQVASMSDGHGQSAAKGVQVIYTRAPWALRQVTYQSGPTIAQLKDQIRLNYTTFLLSTGEQDLKLADFTFAPPASATAFDPTTGPVGNALRPGSVAPDFSVSTAAGTAVKLSDYAGKVVVIDLWATWCEPCQMSLPHTEKIAADYQPKGVVFLPICVYDTHDHFAGWLQAHKSSSMAFLFDPAGRSPSSFAAALYRAETIPTQFVIGKDGKIVSTLVGYSPGADPNETTLTKAIDKALAAG